MKGFEYIDETYCEFDSEFYKKACKYFSSITDVTRPEYWSNEMLEHNKTENEKVNQFIENAKTFDEIVDYMMMRVLRYLSCKPVGRTKKEPYNLYGNCGNGSPKQYDCSTIPFMGDAINILYENFGVIDYKENIGYDIVLHRRVSTFSRIPHVEPMKRKNNEWYFQIKYNPQLEGRRGFHDELLEKVKEVKKYVDNYKKKSKWFNTPIPVLLNELEEIK